MEIKVNPKQIDFIITSDVTEGVFINGSLHKYSKLDGFTLHRKKPSFIERCFGKSEGYDKVFPTAFYLHEDYYSEYLLESEITSNHFIKDNKIFSKPFVAIFQNSKCLGVVYFETFEEVQKYTRKRFGNLGLKTFAYSENFN